MCSLQHFPDRPAEVKNAFCSSQKVRDEWNYNATITVDQTLKEMVDWIRPQVRNFEYHLPLEFVTDKTPKIKLNILLFITQTNPLIFNYEFKTQKFHSIHQIHFSLLLLFHPLLLQLLQPQ